MFALLRNLERNWQNIQGFYRALGGSSGPEGFETCERVCSSLLYVPATNTPAHDMPRAACIRAVQN
eukprot:6521980-Pyramimonas_sp.AAC.1